MSREVVGRCSRGHPYLREAEVSARWTAASSRRFLSSPWIHRPSVVDGSGIARSSIAAAARFWPTPLKAGGSLALASSIDTALDVLGPMMRFSGECSACPLSLDVLPELHKLPCFLVELGLHLAYLLELCVLTPRGDWYHS
jgi:hypothetical protein